MERQAARIIISIILMVVSCISFSACGSPQQESTTETRSMQESEPTQLIPSAIELTSTKKPALVPSELAGLSNQQEIIVEEFSWPQSFTIFEAEDEQGDPVRYETWTYYDGQISYIFLDGIFHFDQSAEILPNNSIPTPHHPNQFTLGTSIDQQLTSKPDIDWVKMPGIESLQEDMQIYLSTQLMAGFTQDHLIYVEVMALVPGEIQ
jgi:hypothetical protein